MRASRICAKLDRDLPVLLTTLHLADPSVFELASLMGFDGIWLDLEHHAHSLETAQNLMRAARIGESDVVARPAKGEFMRLGRLLEAGAQGIMYPRCDDAAEAAEVVKWAKFPPLGKRGCDGGNPDMPYCSMPLEQYIREANRETFVVIQIEEESALSNVDEIAAIDGVRVIFLGPGDFSSLGGFAGQWDHPRLQQACEQIAAAAQRHGKHWGRPVFSVADAQKCIAMGARFLPHCSDMNLVKSGLERIQRDFAGAGFSFENRLAAAPRLAQLPGPHFVATNRDGNDELPPRNLLTGTAQ
jgi:4-hydroxy-2-oxoheptanedioate aldolase